MAVEEAPKQATQAAEQAERERAAAERADAERRAEAERLQAEQAQRDALEEKQRQDAERRAAEQEATAAQEAAKAEQARQATAQREAERVAEMDRIAAEQARRNAEERARLEQEAAGAASLPAAAAAAGAPAKQTHPTKEFKPPVPGDIHRRLQDFRKPNSNLGRILVEAIRKAVREGVFAREFAPVPVDEDDPFAETGIALRHLESMRDPVNTSFRITDPERVVIEDFALYWSNVNGFSLKRDPDTGAMPKFPPGSISTSRIVAAALNEYLPAATSQGRR